MRNIIILLFLLLFPLWGAAQTKYSGRVSDAGNKHPLDVVSVCLLNASGDVLGYCYSDPDGTFSLTNGTRESVSALSFQLLGYSPKKLDVKSFRNGQDVLLEQSSLKIREVKVVSNRIRQQNDTTTYSVSGFSMPQDRSIEDVLRKMPGVDVLPSGTIKVNNRSISALYIDGMNLLNGKYTLGTKNIPWDMVRDVQVLHRHEAVAARRGRSFSENVALNLVLKDDAHNRIIPMLDLALGVRDDGTLNHEARLMGMMFGRKTQNISMYKNANTGQNIISELQDKVNLLQGQMEEPDMLYDAFQTPEGLPSERYQFNDAHLAAVNHLHRFREDAELKVQLDALHEQNEGYQSNTTSYTFPGESYTVGEYQEYNSIQNRASCKIDFQLNSPDLYVKEKMEGLLQLNRSWNNMAIDQMLSSRHKSHLRQQALGNNLEVIRNYDKHSMALYSDLKYSELPQWLAAGSEPFQEVNLKSFQSHSYTYLQHRLLGLNIRYQVGFNYQKDRLTSQAAQAGNDLSLQKYRFYITPSFMGKKGGWQYNLSLPLALQRVTLDYQEPAEEKETVHRWMPEPSLDLSYRPNGNFVFAYRSDYGFRESGIRNLYRGFIYTNYKTASAYDTSFTYETSWVNSLRVNYSNPMIGLFGYLAGSYTQGWNKSVVYSDYEGTGMVRNRTKALPHKTESQSLSGQLSKSFAWAKSMFTLGGSLSSTHDELYLSGQLTPYRSKVRLLSMSLSMRPASWLSLEGSSSWTDVQTCLDFQKETAATSYCRGTYKLETHFLISAGSTLTFSQDMVHNTRIHKDSYFADVSFNHKFKRCELTLLARNLSNAKEFLTTQESANITSITCQQIRPREFLVKLMFDL